MCVQQIHLWRAEQLSGVLEIDPQYTVLKADAAVGHMLGIPAFKLQRKTLGRYDTQVAHGSSMCVCCDTSQVKHSDTL